MTKISLTAGGKTGFNTANARPQHRHPAHYHCTLAFQSCRLCSLAIQYRTLSTVTTEMTIAQTSSEVMRVVRNALDTSATLQTELRAFY